MDFKNFKEAIDTGNKFRAVLTDMSKAHWYGHWYGLSPFSLIGNTQFVKNTTFEL